MNYGQAKSNVLGTEPMNAPAGDGSALDLVEQRLSRLVEASHAHNCRADELLDGLLGSEPTPCVAPKDGAEPHSKIGRIMRLLDELGNSTDRRARLIVRLERI